VCEEEHGALLTLRIMRGSIATQKKITRIKVFINFHCFYAFDSAENLRAYQPFFAATSLAIIMIMGRILGNIYFSTNQKPANCFLLCAGDEQTLPAPFLLENFFRSW
jgi:hypothetical protein